MNKRSILAIAVMLVFGLSVAAFAYQQTTGTDRTAMSCCCCNGDSCPMKKKDASTGEKASCCDDCDCCKGDSCPMKKKGKKTGAAEMRIHGIVVASSSETCSCSCCDHKKDN